MQDQGVAGDVGSRSGPGATAEQTTEALKREGRQALESVKETGRAAADERKADAADFLRDLSSAVHSGAAELRNRQRTQTADYIERAADSLAGLGDDLERRDLRELVDRVDSLARRQPMLTAALGLAAGFALVRFARSSRENGGWDAPSGNDTSTTHEARR